VEEDVSFVQNSASKLDKKIIHLVLEFLRKGMTQQQIARQTGVSQATVSRIARRLLGLAGKRGRPKGSSGRRQRRGIEAMLRLCEAILHNPASDPQALAEASGLHPKAAVRHLVRLLSIARSALLARRASQAAREAAAELARDAAGDRELAAALGVLEVLEAAGERGAVLLLEAALARWEACTAGARGIANAVELSKYHRTAAGLLRLMRRFLPPDLRRAAAQASVDPAPLRHPAPRLGRVRTLHDYASAEGAARAQIRHERAGLATVPGPEVLYAYHILVAQRPSPARDRLIALYLAKAIRGARVIAADTPTSKIVFLQFKEAAARSRDAEEAVRKSRSRAIVAAMEEAFLLGRRRLRGRVRRNILSHLALAWSILLQPSLPGEEPAAYRNRIEAEIDAAAKFFTDAQNLPPVDEEWPEPWTSEPLDAPEGADELVARGVLEPREFEPHDEHDEAFWTAVAAAGGGRVFGRGAKAQAWDAKNRGGK
jgi:AraC-like DNA-binding protein